MGFEFLPSRTLEVVNILEVKVLYYEDGILALEKPAGTLIDAYPWYPNAPSMVFELKQQREQDLLGKYDLKNIYGIYALEPEVTGVGLIACNKETCRYLRNVFGSDQMLFRFIFLSKSSLNKDSLECDLPIAKHYTEERVVISNKTGKKCKTLFKLLAASGDYQVWEAKTTYLRMHQIRIHASESGISILGDNLYGNPDQSIPLKKEARKNAIEDMSRVEGICLHLSSVEWAQGEERVRIYSELPNKLQGLLLKYHLPSVELF